MKLVLTILSSFIFLLNTIISQDFDLSIERQMDEWVFFITPTNSNNVPMQGDIMTDMTFTVKFPTSAGVTVNTTTANSFISKSGPIDPHPTISGVSIQQFRVKPGPDGNGIELPSDMTLNVAYEIGRAPFSASTPTQNDNAELAPHNEIASNQPNIGINLNDHITDVLGFAPLPIIMKTFSATRLGERSARLDWMTSSEVNSAYFGIERSKDALVWENIGYVQATGNSDTEKSYEFVDDKLPLGRNANPVFYYRLKLVDLDGKFNYSDIRGVNFRNSFDGIIKVYPNPAVSNIHIDLSGWEDAGENTSLHIFDSTGKSMLVKNIIGQGIELIDVSAWPSGSYHINVSHNGQTDHHRFVKVD